MFFVDAISKFKVFPANKNSIVFFNNKMGANTIPDIKKSPQFITVNSTAQRSHLITTNEPISEASDLEKLSNGRKNLRHWLGQTFRIVISDGRILVGFFNCTDKDANVVLSMCTEYLEEGKDARLLGNVMIPGKHIKSISIDMPKDEAFADNTAYT